MNIDVILMGSSHMEALQLMQADNCANILAALSGKKVYNAAIRGHDFTNCAGHFENALKKYRPSKFAVIETMIINFSDEELNQILQHKVASKNKTFSQENIRADGLRGFYAKYLREFIHKNFFPIFSMIVGRVKNLFPCENVNINSVKPVSSNNPVLLSKVLKRMSETVKNFGAKLIIAYHPLVELENDGSLKILGDDKAVKVFAEACKENGIYFIDMSERFLSEYKKNYTVPNGFFNTSIASGHMNKYGHRMLAEEIYKLMQKIEK